MESVPIDQAGGHMNADEWLGRDEYDSLALPDLNSDGTPFRPVAVQKLEYCKRCDVLMFPAFTCVSWERVR